MIKLFNSRSDMSAKYVASIIIAGLTVSSAVPSVAQIGGLGDMARGLLGGSSGAAAQDPDIFLSEAIESTKQVMVAAAVLAQMARNKDEMASISERVHAIQNIQNARELGSYDASFKADIVALEANAADAEALHAIYESADEEQRELMIAAGSNLLRGMYLNMQLGQQFSDLLRTMAGNPSHWGKVGHARQLGSMIMAQANAARSMVGPVSSLLRQANVPVPEQANLGEARTISL